MPLDQAIYAPTPNRIYGVRGGYVYEFNATTGALIQAFRYQAPAFGDASIAYDTVNDKIFCSVWRDMAFANGGDTNYDIITSKKLYRITPTTPMAVDASAEINGVLGFPGYIAADQQHLGPHRILYYGGHPPPPPIYTGSPVASMPYIVPPGAVYVAVFGALP